MWDDVLKILLGKTAKAKRVRGSRLDKIQAAADVGGVFDQSGITDLANAAVSLVRGLGARTKAEQRGHMQDALIRGISAIPIVGDVAKLARSRKYAELAKGGSAAARTTPTASAAKPAGSGATVSGGFLSGLLSSFRTQPQPRPIPDQVKGAPGFVQNVVTSLTSRMSESRQQPGVPTPAPGLSPKEKLSMMGMPAQQIEDANRQRMADQESAAAQEEANQRFEELSGKLKSATKGIGAFTAAMIAVPKLVERWGTALAESRRNLASYDGRLAAAYARMDVKQIRRDIETARDTGGSSAAVVNELAKLRGMLQPWREDLVRIENALARVAIESAQGVVFLGNMFRVMSGWGSVMALLERWLGQGGNASMPIHEVIDALIKEGKGQGQRAPLPPL